MKIKKLVRSQRLFLVVLSLWVVQKGVNFFEPWVYAFFDESNTNESLRSSTPRFLLQIVIETLRFLLSFLIVYAIYLYNKFLSNINNSNYFSLDNSKYLAQCGYVLIGYSISIYLFGVVGLKEHVFNVGIVVFIGIILISFSRIFLAAFKQKQENDLTI